VLSRNKGSRLDYKRSLRIVDGWRGWITLSVPSVAEDQTVETERIIHEVYREFGNVPSNLSVISECQLLIGYKIDEEHSVRFFICAGLISIHLSIPTPSIPYFVFGTSVVGINDTIVETTTRYEREKGNNVQTNSTSKKLQDDNAAT